MALFDSKTIPPSFKMPHLLYALYLIGGAPDGVGRYRIKKEIQLGEGSARTLLGHLKDAGMIDINEKNQKGHILTAKGQQIYLELLDRISYPQEITNTGNKFVVGNAATYVLLKHKHLKPNLILDIRPRDEAIKIGGTGATVVRYTGTEFQFADSTPLPFPIPLDNLLKGDLLVLGGGTHKNQAILATLAAALLLVDL
jgi:predicted transcriptional regulator